MPDVIHKVVTDTAVAYTWYSTVGGRFIKPPLSLDEAASHDPSTPLDEFEEIADAQKLDLRRETIEHFESLIAKLERGEALEESESLIVADFCRFLDGTIAGHQLSDPAFNEVVRGWIQGLDVRYRSGELEGVLFSANEIGDIVYLNAPWTSWWFRELTLHAPEALEQTRRTTPTPTIQENKLSGLYLRAISDMISLFDPCTNPLEVIRKFYEESLTQH